MQFRYFLSAFLLTITVMAGVALAANSIQPNLNTSCNTTANNPICLYGVACNPNWLQVTS